MNSDLVVGARRRLAPTGQTRSGRCESQVVRASRGVKSAGWRGAVCTTTKEQAAGSSPTKGRRGFPLRVTGLALSSTTHFRTAPHLAKSCRPKLSDKAPTQIAGLREALARAGRIHSGSKVRAAQLHQRTRASRPERRRKFRPLLIYRTYIPGICSAREVACVVAAWASGIFANPPM